MCPSVGVYDSADSERVSVCVCLLPSTGGCLLCLCKHWKGQLCCCAPADSVCLCVCVCVTPECVSVFDGDGNRSRFFRGPLELIVYDG